MIWVFLISLHEPIHLRFNDNLFYLDMATNGIVDNDKLASPFAYRTLTPVMANQLASMLSISIEQAFYGIAIVSAVAQLFLVFVLAKRFNAADSTALIAVSVVALSYYNLRFLIIDSLRPDHLAYPLMVVVFLLVLSNWRLSALVISLVAINIREFFLIPPVIIGLLYYQDYLRRRKRSFLWLALLSFITPVIIFMLQRLLIRVVSAAGYLEPLRYDFIPVLLSTPLNMAHNINVVLALAGYLLPLLLLITPERWRAIRAGRRPVSLILTIYCLMVFGFTFYGGTDIGRFVTYLFIPMTVWLVLLLNEGIPAVETGYMLVTVAMYNRILIASPQTTRDYIDFRAAFSDYLNESTWRFFAALIVIFAGMFVLRRIWSRTSVKNVPLSA